MHQIARGLPAFWLEGEKHVLVTGQPFSESVHRLRWGQRPWKVSYLIGARPVGDMEVQRVHQ